MVAWGASHPHESKPFSHMAPASVGHGSSPSLENQPPQAPTSHPPTSLPHVGFQPQINHMKLNKHTWRQLFYRQTCVSHGSNLSLFLFFFSQLATWPSQMREHHLYFFIIVRESTILFNMSKVTKKHIYIFMHFCDGQ
jgi:hypothetical protein